MENSIHIEIFKNLPSSVEFATQIEPRNVPAVFIGCVKNWIAFSKWNPSNGGLDYLLERIGSYTVEAMLSRSAPVFYGDLKSHERVPLPFSSFIGACKQHLQHMDDGDSPSHSVESVKQGVAVSEIENDIWLSVDAPQQIYLAQIPIMNIENDERVQLESLREDIETPTVLGSKQVTSINLWMNNAHARSSTHYDPHNNLLCVVSGCKQVVLWPPSASPLLYPMPLFGEASNHSSVSLENPDLSTHARAKCLQEHSQKVILHAGDALFIPEGWFHQVDSDDLTIAVNFWWGSNIMSSMAEHMDAYYLRRILRRLIDKEMNQLLRMSSAAGKGQIQISELPKNEEAGYLIHDLDHKCLVERSNGKRLKQKIALHELDPLETQALHEIVSLVHVGVHVAELSKPDQCPSTSGSTCTPKRELGKGVLANLFHLEEDPVANIIWTVGAHALQNIFLAMVTNFPRTLEALILHLLSPIGAEVLTRKFDELDQVIHEDDRNQFYEAFYGVFDDQFAAMDAILKGKELFALQAYKNVMDQHMGVNFDGPKPVVR